MEIKWLVKLFGYIFSLFFFFFSMNITILKEKSALEKIIWKTTIFQRKYRYCVAKAHLCNFFPVAKRLLRIREHGFSLLPQ